jgi:outer membrane protein
MRAKTITQLLCVASTFSLGAAAIAQDPANRPGNRLSTALAAPASEADGPAVVDGRMRLSLEEAVAIALERNLGLDVERYTRAISLFGIQRNQAIYDLQLGANVNMFESESFRVDALAGEGVVTAEGQSGSASVSQLLSTGATVEVGFDTSRSDNSVEFRGGPSLAFDTSWNSSLEFSITQPLLRNFGRLPTERGITVARLASDASREQFESQVANTLRDVENAYWVLVEAIAQVKVSEEGLKLARELHEMNKIRVEVGTLAPLELVQSEAGIATREEEIIRTQAAVGNAEDQLRRLLNLAGDAWGATIEPTTDAETQAIEVRVDESIREALANRPEVARQRLTVETLRVDADWAANQLKPRLDANAGYGSNGFGLNSDGWEDAIEQVAKNELKGWRVGLTFAYPLQNRAAKAQKTIADLDLERAQLQLADLEQTVSTEVRQAVRNVETARKSVDSARVSRRLAEKNLDAERKRYENGLSTSFQVLQIQEDLTLAASREVAAVTGYRRALTEYYRVIGRLLDQSQVELVDEVTRIEEQRATR